MASSWMRSVYPCEGDGVGFDRVVFFSDAVFAIALTLAAVEIGLPEVEGDSNSVADLWEAVAAKGAVLLAFLVAFVWVAIYWRANHRFVMTLRAMDSAFVLATLLFLALIALLPIPAGILGEYWNNPLAITLFAIYASAVSGMELVLFLIARRDRLFIAQPGAAFARVEILGSLSPIVIFLTSIPLAFVSTTVALLWWPLGSMLAGYLLSRMHAEPPEDPSPA